MKRFVSAVCFCSFLLLLGVFFLLPQAQAENNILMNLLNLPAPPPPNPFVTKINKNYPPEFYSKYNPPKDDAPIEEILDYWAYQNSAQTRLGYNVKPSEAVLDRIIAACESDPEKLQSVLNLLNGDEKNSDLVKRLYDQNVDNKDFNEDWRYSVKNWLDSNSKYYDKKLLQSAESVQDAGEYVTGQDELLMLADIDWETAKPIIERLLNNPSQPVSQTLARWAMYRHAIQNNDSIDIEKYRDALKATVENKSASDGNRDLAIDALSKEKDWQGRDDWYFSLLEDETLADLKVNGQTYTGLTTFMYYSPTEKYLDKMLQLLKSNNKNVRTAAIKNLIVLITDENPEVVKALLPWLEDKNWANASTNERSRIVQILQRIEMPESVPGLISILDEKETVESRQFLPVANTAVNAVVNTATDGEIINREVYPHRFSAIQALAKQKNPQAISALRQVLPEVDDYEFTWVIKALIACNGFSVPEQVEALELNAKERAKIEESQAVAANMASNAVTISAPNMIAVGNYAANSGYPATRKPYTPELIKLTLGSQVAEGENVTNELVNSVINRIEILEKKQPKIANVLREILKNWSGTAINSLFLRDLRNNKADVTSIIKLLSIRKELKEKQNTEVYDARSGNAIANGISACILEENSDYEALLNSENADSKTAMLACARLIRADLPIAKVAENLKNPNKTLALAAERYLESQDSPEARQIVLSLHPNKAKILGARDYFSTGNDDFSSFLEVLFTTVVDGSNYFYSDYSSLEKMEKNLQKEVIENKDLIGIYAYDDNFIRIYNDRTVFSWEEDSSRYRERTLNKEEIEYFQNYIVREKVDDFPPFLGGYCEHDGECKSVELLMLGKNGGRRIFVRNFENKLKFTKDLNEIFSEMRKPPAKLHYWLEKYLPNLNILFEDENLQTRSIWKNGDDFRVLVEDKSQRERIDTELEKQFLTDQENTKLDDEKLSEMNIKRRNQRDYEEFTWRKFDQNKLGDFISQPTQSEYIPKRDGIFPFSTQEIWKSRVGNIEYRASYEELFKIKGGQKTKFKSGNYTNLITTANGRWLIATKNDDYPPKLVRINLLTGKESNINIVTPNPIFRAIAFLPVQNKVLIVNSLYEYESEAERETLLEKGYYLLDAETGLTQKVKGEFRPILQQTYRSLQPNGKPDEFWAAIPNLEKEETQFGVYNAKTFSFKLWLKIPKIQFSSMEMFVDEKDQKIYFVYEGQLLSLPMPKIN